MVNSSLLQANTAYVSGSEGNRLACRVLGETHKRTVVLTSGIGCGPVFVESIAAEFAQDHRVVYWDYRGHGDSDVSPKDGGYTIAEHASDLDEVVKTLVPNDEYPIMIGFSMGVQVTIEWSRLNPNRAGAFVFMLGLPRNPMHRTLLLRSQAGRLAEGIGRYGSFVLKAIQPAVASAIRSRLTYQIATKLGWVAKDCPRDAFMDFLQYATTVPLDAYLRCAGGILEHDATAPFLKITQPVFMLAADDDLLIDANEVRRYADMLPQAKFEKLQYASHAGSLEYGTYFAGAVRRFLRRIAFDQRVADG